MPSELVIGGDATGLMAVAVAAKQIVADGMQVTVGGGVESISLVQNEHRNSHRSQDPWLVRNGHDIYVSMLDTAEEEIAAFSGTRLLAGDDPEHPQRVGFTVELDEGNRPSTTIETLAGLRAVLPDRDGHRSTVSAGNASQLSDGAAALVLMEASEAARVASTRSGSTGGSPSRAASPTRWGSDPCSPSPAARATRAVGRRHRSVGAQRGLRLL